MYRVLVVDDEPAAVQYVKKLIELKCGEDFEVAGTASDGAEAVKLLEQDPDDVVITDVMMPGMNGIELVSWVQENRPNMVSVVVSGYQDFEYVQGAIRAGVCDYLLKPIDPEEIRKLFERIKGELDQKYYTRRNQILHQLSTRGGKEVDWQDLGRIFPGEHYYAAIIRKNERISGLSGRSDQELYSIENERVIIYGRDSMEMLYIYDEDLIVHDFFSTMNHEYYKQQEEGVYLTMVVKEDPFVIGELPQVMEELYLTLDQSIVIGLNQMISLGREEGSSGTGNSDTKFDHIMYLARSKDTDRALNELGELFALWEAERCPQFLVKENIRYLLYELQHAQLMGPYDEYLLEDAFSNVMGMQELCGNICEFIQQNLTDQTPERKPDREETFREITQYLQNHPSERLSVQDVCKRFGISQATMNRLFRSFAEMSYNSYLTDMRIRISRELLEQNPESYIKDVAEAVGYNDQFYFSRIFRTVTGMSPTEYVERLHEEKTEAGDK